MKYSLIGLFANEIKFLRRAITALLLVSTKKEDHETGEMLLKKLGEEADNGKDN